MITYTDFEDIKNIFNYIYEINQIMKNSKINSKYFFSKKSKSYRMNSEYGAGYLALNYNIDDKYLKEFKRLYAIVNGAELFKFINENVKHKSDIVNIDNIEFNKDNTFTIKMKNGNFYTSTVVVYNESNMLEIEKIKEYEELDKYFKNNEIGYIELSPKDIELLLQSVTPEIFYNKDKTYKTFLSNRSIYNFPKSDIKNGIKMEFTTFKEMIIINRFIIKNKKYILKNIYKSLNFNYSKQIV